MRIFAANFNAFIQDVDRLVAKKAEIDNIHFFLDFTNLTTTELNLIASKLLLLREAQFGINLSIDRADDRVVRHIVVPLLNANKLNTLDLTNTSDPDTQLVLGLMQNDNGKYRPSTTITAQGARLIAKCLPNSTKLMSMDISYNNIGDSGAFYLYEGILRQPNLVRVSMYYCGLTEQSVIKMRSLKRHHKNNYAHVTDHIVVDVNAGFAKQPPAKDKTKRVEFLEELLFENTDPACDIVDAQQFTIGGSMLLDQTKKVQCLKEVGAKLPELMREVNLTLSAQSKQEFLAIVKSSIEYKYFTSGISPYAYGVMSVILLPLAIALFPLILLSIPSMINGLPLLSIPDSCTNQELKSITREQLDSLSIKIQNILVNYRDYATEAKLAREAEERRLQWELQREIEQAEKKQAEAMCAEMEKLRADRQIENLKAIRDKLKFSTYRAQNEAVANEIEKTNPGPLTYLQIARFLSLDNIAEDHSGNYMEAQKSYGVYPKNS